ncbi:MAG: hypothetical protein IKA04_11195, partial [Alistipes sp.]|nr:hypothetical protein [Alistipes sp.]
FSILNSQFSVLSFQFSVLNSQFSALSSQLSALNSQLKKFSVLIPLRGLFFLAARKNANKFAFFSRSASSVPFFHYICALEYI